jgi:hypothetical protein
MKEQPHNKESYQEEYHIQLRNTITPTGRKEHTTNTHHLTCNQEKLQKLHLNTRTRLRITRTIKPTYHAYGKPLTPYVLFSMNITTQTVGIIT